MSTTTGQGFVDCQVLANTIISDLIAGGMVLKFPASFSPTVYKATLETSVTVDPLAATQPWRIHIDATVANTIRIVSATSTQLPDSGTVALDIDNSILGHLGTGTTTYKDFIDRTLYGDQNASSMTYRLTTAAQGIALAIWEPGTDLTMPIMSYFTIQRPVNNRNGTIRQTGKSPVYCLYGINRSATALVNKFVVRESDVIRPSGSVDATIDTADSFKSISVNTIVAITEESNYVIFFPNSLNTQRYAYPQDDLDLIAYTSADVISTGSTCSLPVYNEPFYRTYTCLLSNQNDNTGMRILLLSN